MEKKILPDKLHFFLTVKGSFFCISSTLRLAWIEAAVSKRGAVEQCQKNFLSLLSGFPMMMVLVSWLLNIAVGVNGIKRILCKKEGEGKDYSLTTNFFFFHLAKPYFNRNYLTYLNTNKQTIPFFHSRWNRIEACSVFNLKQAVTWNFPFFCEGLHFSNNWTES